MTLNDGNDIKVKTIHGLDIFENIGNMVYYLGNPEVNVRYRILGGDDDKGDEILMVADIETSSLILLKYEYDLFVEARVYSFLQMLRMIDTIEHEFVKIIFESHPNLMVRA